MPPTEESRSLFDIEIVATADLVPYARNAKMHPPEQVAQIVASIREFGWTVPILADAYEVVAGHGRLMAAKEIYAGGGTISLPDGRSLPAGTVPVINCAGWSEAQRRAYVLADNQISENGGWDDDLRRLELTFLEAEGFDIGLTGLDEASLAAILGGGENEPGEPQPDPLKIKLADRFGIPPFSVMNAREGWWQDRKRAWLALGIQSELGRGEGDRACPGGSPLPGNGSRKDYKPGKGKAKVSADG